MCDVLSHLVHVWRRWRARPLVPLLAGAVLAAGIGAGAAVFAVTWTAVLAPLRAPGVDRQWLITTDFPGMKLRGLGLSAPEALELRDLTTSLRDVGFGLADPAGVRLGDTVFEADVILASAGLLRALDAQALQGRLFDEDEDRPGAPAVALVQEGFWRRAFGGVPLLGRTIAVDGRDHTVVGILPRSVTFAGRPADVWIPLRYDSAGPAGNRANHAFTVVARARDDVPVAAVRDDITRAMDRWQEATGQFHSPSTEFHPLGMTPLVEHTLGPLRSAAGLMVGAVALVILAAIANAASLLSAGAQARRVEFALRGALGASRGHLWRPVVVETSLLAVGAGVAGAGIAWVGSQALLAIAPPALFNRDLLVPTRDVVLGAGGLTLLAALLCSVIASTHVPTQASAATLALADRGAHAAGPVSRLRGALVGLEVALTLVLCVGATALAESLWRLSRVDLGFSPASVTRASLNLPDATYDSPARVDAFYRDVAARLAATPGVVAAGAMSGLLPERRPNNTSIAIDGGFTDHMGTPPIQFIQLVTPGFFDALSLTARDGRLFTDADTAASQPVVILNARAAAAYFPDRPAVGGRLRTLLPGRPWLTVVGVVGDLRQQGLTADAGTEMFVPLSQVEAIWNFSPADLHLVVRTDDRVAGGVNVIRDAVRALDPQVAMAAAEPLADTVARTTASTRFLASLVGGFAIVSIGLALTGLYGVITHIVAARTRDIAIRRALGAAAPSIVALLARQMAPLLAGGLAAGSVAALAGSRLLAPYLYALEPLTPARWLAFVMLALVMAVVACLRPARRALRIDPARALAN